MPIRLWTTRSHSSAGDNTMTEADDKANCRHLAALIGSRDTRWCEHIEQAPKVLDVQWDKLPPAFRRKWWRATDYGQHPPSPGTAALLPALLAAAQNKLEAAKAKAKTDTIRALAVLHQAEARLPCGQCRSTTPCKARCLTAILGPPIDPTYLDEGGKG
jgi:hypothetical protein